MTEQNDADILSGVSVQYKKYPLWLELLVIVAVSGLLVGGYKWFTAVPKVVDNGIISDVVDTQSPKGQATSNFVFALKLVPDALDVIQLTSNRDEALDANKLAEYRAEYTDNTSPEAVSSDSPYNLHADQMSILTVIESDAQHALLLQVHDELLALAQHYDESLGQPSPREQGVGTDASLPYEAAAATVSPSTHVVLALYFADIFKTVAGEQVYEQIDMQTRELINRGVVSGLYTYSDIATSEELYRQYTALLLERYPELKTVISGLQ